MSPENVAPINTIALLFTIVMGLLTITLPRRWAFAPLLITACYVTLGQQFVIANLHFTFFRILILVGWLRLFLRGELVRLEFNTLDKALFLWSISCVVLGTLLEGSVAGFVNRLGLAYNALGIYFLFRFLLRDLKDIDKIFATLSIILAPLAAAMVLEYMTGRNLFSILGGVPEVTMVRDGRMRCQGPFAHPILAGTFGATLVSLVLSQYFEPYNKKILAAIGVICALIITVTASSSGPLMALVSVIIGLLMWKIRWKMRYVRWAMGVTIILLQMVMQSSVWFLIGRLSNVTGGDGWHRSALMDAAIQHIDEWWLIGTNYTKHWLTHDTLANPNMIDITNQYIWEGVNGGVVRLGLFIAMIVACFKTVGRAIRVEFGELCDRKLMVWCMGVALISHLVSFISVSYFDQIVVFWYLLLAMIATIAQLVKLSTDKEQLVAKKKRVENGKIAYNEHA